MLEIKGLNVFYGKAQVLFNIDMKVNEGEITALLGRNGAGKTTLLKSIMGIDVVKNGKILFKGVDISNMRTYRIAALGVSYVPDYTGLFPGMSVLENLQLALNRRKIDLTYAYTLYPELKHLLDRKADALSGGERKIVSIIRSVLTRPKLLLLDEPTEGVMPILTRRIYELLGRLKNDGITILLVEQGIRLSIVKNIATKIGIIANGRFIYESEPERLEREIDIVKKYLAV